MEQIRHSIRAHRAGSWLSLLAILVLCSSAFAADTNPAASGETNQTDVALTPVPEPSTWVAMFGGMALLVGLRYRRF